MDLKKMKKPIVAMMSAVMLMGSPLATMAETGDAKKQMPNIKINSKSAVLYDMNLDKIIYEKNADEVLPTASLAKIMTLYLGSEAIDKGKVKTSDEVKISEKAWKTNGSKMFLAAGKYVPFSELMKGAAVVSGNDASVAIAEYVSGSTDAFVNQMNEKAKKLNMTNTSFKSVNGLPVGKEVDTSTARDLATLTVDYLEKYPTNLEFHKLETYTTPIEYSGGKEDIPQKNRNPLLSSFKGADGLKTGWVDGNYNFIGTAERNGVRLAVVLLGGTKSSDRRVDGEKLLKFGFDQYKVYSFHEKGELVEKMPVYKAKGIRKVETVFENDVEMVVHNSFEGEIREEIVMNNGKDYVLGGKENGEVVGVKNYYMGENLVHTANIIITEDLPEAGWLAKIFDNCALMWRWFQNKLL